jgi:carboxymethylenebutenolidase
MSSSRFSDSLRSRFATTVQPDAADSLVMTPAIELRDGEVQISTATGKLPAYRAMPARPGPHPIVLVVHEIFGVHEHIRDVARRLAHLGYFAIVPDLYFRQGDPSQASSMAELREKIYSKVPDAQVLGDLDQCLAWAGLHGGNIERAAITGFCWGGRIAWLYAAHQPQLRAGVAWYGKVRGPTNVFNPRHPVDVAGALKAPVLGLYGGQDSSIPLEHVQQQHVQLKLAGNVSKLHVYPDAPHAFFADYRSSYRDAEAQDGWQRMQAWFRQHGV